LIGAAAGLAADAVPGRELEDAGRAALLAVEGLAGVLAAAVPTRHFMRWSITYFGTNPDATRRTFTNLWPGERTMLLVERPTRQG